MRNGRCRKVAAIVCYGERGAMEANLTEIEEGSGHSFISCGRDRRRRDQLDQFYEGERTRVNGHQVRFVGILWPEVIRDEDVA